MAIKRPASSVGMPPAIRRSRPTCVGYLPFAVLNVEDGETVHQACLLVSGQCHSFDGASGEDFVSAKCTDGFRETSGLQNWPAINGSWKALVMLTPGANHLEFELYHSGGVSGNHKLVVNYLPLLQLPPLHLAIMVAKDSPLLIDCPPVKRGAISSAHSDLDAAIAKFRMTAYMWQALTAEDMRQKGLGRRSFRFEEEWSVETTAQQAYQSFPATCAKTGSHAKIHIVRSEKTVMELRDRNCAQQYESGYKKAAMHEFFEAALKAYGGPFASNNHPVVAGLILDSAYSTGTNLIHAHAALGSHNPNGLSLAVFGSHLTYSWPRFLEEVPACLLDNRDVGDTVGNDNGECNTLRDACSVGQGAFLHEVGHAFSAEHTNGIMARGYSKHWSRNFLGYTENENDAKWDLEDALRFKTMPHFRLPGDMALSNIQGGASIEIKHVSTDGHDGVSIASVAGLAYVEITNGGKTKRTELINWDQPCTKFEISNVDVEGDRSDPLSITVLNLHGRKRTMSNLWLLSELFSDSPIPIPGSDIVLHRHSSKSGSQCLQSEELEMLCHEWALLLTERGPFGKGLHRATAIDLRVGCTMDGAVVYYGNSHQTNCGLPDQQNFGGHASQKQELPEGAEIVKVELRQYCDGWAGVQGIRMTLDNGKRWGELHDHDSEEYCDHGFNTVVLEPQEGQRIIGFFGRSDRSSGYCRQFGIITAPRDREMPENLYDMKKLQNRGNPLNAFAVLDEDHEEVHEIEEQHEDSDDYDDLASEHTIV